ncbi:sugar phosphate isomerase/epimerase [Algoriphagus aestuariicola]|uniref:Sugar phosphate isomerase/epimerase n=1 Tax=Algoriphagus aestuariicola TaxID=1852016 RepID=A0ABS3BLP2_9BACT|nr:TIM barrel protein [Algoriphagus aestuariicola]MBN7800078.1 sugar phosphate isomerase/epimerase [Algoriphagus aestuariicola]
MNLLYFCPLWGSETMPFEQFLQQAKNAGYDGVEMSFPLNEKERNEKAKLIDSLGLKLIAQHWETVDKDPKLHRHNFEKRLRNLASTNPLFINSQTGKDYYTFDQNCELFNLANEIAIETGVPIIHETHRGKWSFAAHITKEYLDRLPDLKITLDISHWCVTAESFLQDQKEAVNKAIGSTAHLHARVGYTEGPQVPDPRVPDWGSALNFHLEWWDRLIKVNKEKEFFTVTPEFGAPPYLINHPESGEPLASQWDVNMWMMNLFKKRYSHLFSVDTSTETEF